MTKPKKLALNANTFRIVLIVLMLIITAAGSVGLSSALRGMRTFAVEVSHKKVDATASNGNIQALEKTQEYLDTNRDVLEKIGLLRSSSEFPEFRVVDEVRDIATKNNIQIQSFSYGTEATSSQTPATTTPSTTPAPTVSASSGNLISLSVTLSSPNYLDFLQFTYDIEQHLPKMKINGIGMSAANGSVNVDPLTVQMYIN
jgi:hypothetical protein